ncbi:conserved hypothetical protein [Histoplasma capsulatum var. duboisii H88]|uniref:Uncharacterized protein n=1 Tax=Ajellomyces capsulatus (strain H88) TaxID=544711 RepID=F0UI16_AJEC8|nr:conserved hypothetical protein [Histoplasma capsulatum var. duboisii H88]
MALSSLLGVNDLSGRVAHNAFNLNRVIQLPPLRPGDCHFTTEIMRFTVTGDHIAAFHFAIEVCADGKMAREAFEWRKLKKGDDATKGRGFQLVRLGAGSEDASQGLFSSTLSPSLGEIVAVLDWPKGLSSLAHNLSRKAEDVFNINSVALGQLQRLKTYKKLKRKNASHNCYIAFENEQANVEIRFQTQEPKCRDRAAIVFLLKMGTRSTGGIWCDPIAEPKSIQ